MAMNLKLSLKLTPKQQQTLVVAGLITIAVGYAYWNYMFSPLLKQAKEKEATLEQKQKELKDAKEMVMKYPEFLQKSKDINRKSDFLNKRLPQVISIGDTITEISKVGAENNIKMIDFVPTGREKDKGDYSEYSINVSFLTNYIDLGNFLTGLGYIERITVPSDIMIEGNTGGTSGATGQVKITMAVMIYSSKD